jgi:hypothetical protein
MLSGAQMEVNACADGANQPGTAGLRKPVRYPIIPRWPWAEMQAMNDAPTTVPSKPHSALRGLFLIPLTVSIAAWSALFVALPPAVQNFPLGDDWAFSRGMFAFARGEGLHYFYFASLPQLGQWLWALPFAWLVPDSHVILRISTIMVSWLGLWAFYDLLRQENCSPGQAAFATGVLALNPLFFVLQGTFHTDLPALSFALLALNAYARALRSGRFGWLAAATVLALFAVLTRQSTVVVSIAALFLLWRSGRLSSSHGWLLTVMIPVVAGIAVHLWFNSRPDVKTLSPRPAPPQTLLLLPFFILHWCGLAALPLLVMAPWWRAWKVFVAAFLVMMAAVVYWTQYPELLRPYGSPFPYTGGMLGTYGSFSPGLVVGERPLLLTSSVRWLITMLGCLGAAGLASVVALKPPRWRASPLLMFTILNIPFLFIAPAVYDRYVLPLLPGVLYLACARIEWRSSGALAGLGLTAVFAVLSVALMHDWMAWNAARWELGRRALAMHIAATRIEGGFEWDGWHSLARSAPVPQKESSGFRLPVAQRSFPDVTGEFALSYSPIEGAVVVDQEAYQVWLPPERRMFYLLRVPDRQPAVKASEAGVPPQ